MELGTLPFQRDMYSNTFQYGYYEGYQNARYLDQFQRQYYNPSYTLPTPLLRQESSPPLSVTSPHPSGVSPITPVGTSQSPIVGSAHNVPTPPHPSPGISPPSSAGTASGRTFFQQTSVMGSMRSPNLVHGSNQTSNHLPGTPTRPQGIYNIGSRETSSDLPTTIQHSSDNLRNSTPRPQYQWMKRDATAGQNL